MQFNISTESNQNKNGDINLAFLSNASFADSEQALCLMNYVFEPNTKSVAKKRCWRDEDGPDVFEGFVYDCEPSQNGGCQPTYCQDFIYCYTTDI